MSSDLFNWRIISKNRNLLFGVAIIWIMLLHATTWKAFDSWEGFRKYSQMRVLYQNIKLGGAGVEVFLFLSGIGMYFSFSRSSDLIPFYIKRLKRVLIPYLVICGSYWALRDLILEWKPVDFIQDLTWITFYTEGDRTYWYIHFILLMYLLYPVFHRLFQSRYRLCWLIVLCAAVYAGLGTLYVSNLELYKELEVAYARIPTFLVGCYFGPLVKEGKPFGSGWVLFSLLTPWIGAFLQYWGKNGGIPWDITMRVWYGMLGLSFCILLSILFTLTDFGKLGKFLNLLGVLSLELYLFHITMKSTFRFLFPEYKSWGMGAVTMSYFLYVMVGSLILSLLYHAAEQKISRLYQERRKEA